MGTVLKAGEGSKISVLSGEIPLTLRGSAAAELIAGSLAFSLCGQLSSGGLTPTPGGQPGWLCASREGSQEDREESSSDERCCGPREWGRFGVSASGQEQAVLPVPGCETAQRTLPTNTRTLERL